MLGMLLSSQGARRCSCRIKREMLSPCWLSPCIPLIFAVILPSCGTRPPSEGPLFGTGVFHPPPKPGASISQTRMCECKACEPSNCCDGPDEDDTPPASCGSSYDFSDNEWCGTSIHSCTSRCAREVWRVSNSEACEVKRPASCCQ